MENNKYDVINYYLKETIDSLNSYEEKFLDLLMPIVVFSHYSAVVGLADFLNDNYSKGKTDKAYVSNTEIVDIVQKILKSIDEVCESDYSNLFNKTLCVINANEPDENLHMSDKELGDFFERSQEYVEDKFSYKVEEKRTIEIKSTHTYDDVITLIHEFFHSTNSSSFFKNDTNRKQFTEMISIYFETYAMDYMINNGICEKGDFNGNFRLENHFEIIMPFFNFGIFLFYFTHIGNLNDKTFNFINDYLWTYSEEEFNKDLEFMKSKMSSIKSNALDKYFDLGFDLQDYEKCDKFVTDYVVDKIKSRFSSMKYILGVMFASYMRSECSVLTAHYINQYINGDYDYKEIFNKMGIDYDEFISEFEANDSVKDRPIERKIFSSFKKYYNDMQDYCKTNENIKRTNQ